MSISRSFMLNLYDEIVSRESTLESLTSLHKLTNKSYKQAWFQSAKIVHARGGKERSIMNYGETYNPKEMRDSSLSELVSSTLMNTLNSYIDYIQTQGDELKIKSFIVYLSTRGLNELLLDFEFNEVYLKVCEEYLKNLISYRDSIFEKWLNYLSENKLFKHYEVSEKEGFNVFSYDLDSVRTSLFSYANVGKEKLHTEDVDFLISCRKDYIDIIITPKGKSLLPFMNLSQTTFDRRKTVIIDELINKFSTTEEIKYLNLLILNFD